MGKAERRIAEFVVETDAKEIPAASYEAARVGCFDCVGVTLAGVPQPHGRMIASYVASEAATGPCTIVGNSFKTGPSMAALANGTIGHALDFDDMGGFGHPSVVLLPPALALCEQLGATGRELLAAYAIGFEVARHLARGATYAQGDQGFHPTAVFGTMGATAVGSRLLGLSVEQTIMALGIAGSMPSGIVQNFGTYTKPLHAGLASRSGVMAALLAREGWLACDNVVESRVGWAAAYLREGNYDPSAMVKDLGTVWTAHETLTIKKYPCCGTTHSTLDSLLTLMRERGFGALDVAEVEVAGLPDISHILLYPQPTSAFQGKFSIQYSLATALLDGKIVVDSFADENLARQELREALGKVAVKTSSKSDPEYNMNPDKTPVTVRLKDGRSFTHVIDRHQMHGTPADPLTDAELRDKFRRNALLTLPERQVEEASRLWWTLDELADVRQATASVAGAVLVG